MNISTILANITQLLKSNGINNPHHEARILLCHIIEKPIIFCLTHSDFMLNQRQVKQIENLAAMRARHKPLHQILGFKEFMSLDFHINCHVLTPRPLTEELCQLVLDKMSKDKQYYILDAGTGSGAIAISICNYHQNTRALGFDASKNALKIAQKNIIKHDLSSRIQLMHAKFNQFQSDKKFDIIISNPPYIDNNDFHDLMPEVKNFEPKMALVAPNAGLKYYYEIKKLCDKYLNKDGIIALESSPQQRNILQEIFNEYYLILA